MTATRFRDPVDCSPSGFTEHEWVAVGLVSSNSLLERDATYNRVRDGFVATQSAGRRLEKELFRP
ncbi:hypothetical protein [Natrialba swarupiae]|uniref:Uncharacterized protein n=1 Tax=Natrialba swarupiae TaxID=2448032 RepID=A0A5D5APP8_9EURY|nr:hypothetical protein [Natrialba swarupiae]TYT63808.1 hypothetical protein FYC77_00870 [Natrialba swarupiae]